MVLMLAQPLAMALALMLMLAPMLALMLALAPAPAQARVLRPPCQHYCRKPRDARGHDGPLVRASQPCRRECATSGGSSVHNTDGNRSSRGSVP